MLQESIAAILDRDLRALRREVEAYPNEQALWQEVPGIANVAGTLVLHLAGNVQHYVGARLGQTGYIRNRPAEFTRRDVSRAELVREIEAARAAVRSALSGSTVPNLEAEFPEVVGSAKVNTGDYLVHLATHFAYHLGQIDYHRRVVTGQGTTIDAMRPSDLSSARSAS
ncbi:MAG TPA: DinB family protein [Gemmatimonadales bacterium]|nr:DinB family protein [Gemmatimonadales bacterium]